jgi:hypothetical protein
VTHEYVIALHGVILGARDATPVPTAIAWAADRILAVGADAPVRAISRGDSTVLDLDGCTVVPLDPAETLEAGAPADLAFWVAGSREAGEPIATVRAGAFTDGDEHAGPFRRA